MSEATTIQQPPEVADGDCYPVAYRFLVGTNLPTVRLCHGTVIRPSDGVRHTHAWIEHTTTEDVPVNDDWLPGDVRTVPVTMTVVVDQANGNNVMMSAAAYYKLGRVHDVTRYTKSEAMRIAVSVGHYGPWMHPTEPWAEIPCRWSGSIPFWVLDRMREECEDWTMTADDVVSIWVDNMHDNAMDQAREDGTLPDLDDDPAICGSCNGAGEDRYEQVCSSCGGRGVER